MKRLLVALLAAALPAFAASVSGVVVNGTTGKPEPRVAVTLISFAQGMDPIEEVYSDAEGRFEFSKEVAGAGMLRADHEAVGYTAMLTPGADRANVRLEVFRAADKPAVAPTGRVLVLEPGAAEMVVNESYLFENRTDPPVTFRDAERGSLRFHLPEAAKGIVQVEASGPARMPLRATAEKTAEPEVWKIDFAIKPGENRISLTYLVPRSDSAPFVSRSLYPGIQTRIALPADVEVDGSDLTPLGVEPSTQAAIYEAAGGDISLVVRGQGRLQRGGAGAEGGGEARSTEVAIAPAPIAQELPWLLGLAAAILALGFWNLLAARAPAEAAASPAAAPAKRSKAR